MCPDPTFRSRMTKAALIAYRKDPKSKNYQKTNVFIFQYNPEMLVRTLSYPDHSEAPVDSQKIKHSESPIEQISLTFELDAADQPEDTKQHQHTIKNGLHPSLASLESMMLPEYRISRQPEPPVVLFHWGPIRTLPVYLTSLKVTEEAFDPNLNPIRARIELYMKVLKDTDFPKGSLGYNVCKDHLANRNSLALLYRQTSIDYNIKDYAVSTGGNINRK